MELAAVLIGTETNAIKNRDFIQYAKVSVFIKAIFNRTNGLKSYYVFRRDVCG